MRSLFAMLLLASVALIPLGAGARGAGPRVAPADEYFGRLGMSILGIRNKLNDISARLDVDSDNGPDQLAGAENVEDAIRDWAQKYPQDTWLDRSAVSLERVYARIETEESQDHLQGFARFIHRKFAGQTIDGDCRNIASQTNANPGESVPRR